MRNVEVEAGGNVFTVKDPGPQKFTDFKQFLGREAVVMQALTERSEGLRTGKEDYKGSYSDALRELVDNIGNFFEQMLNHFETMIILVNGKPVTRETLKTNFINVDSMGLNSTKILGEIAAGIINKLGVDGEVAKNS